MQLHRAIYEMRLHLGRRLRRDLARSPLRGLAVRRENQDLGEHAARAEHRPSPRVRTRDASHDLEIIRELPLHFRGELTAVFDVSCLLVEGMNGRPRRVEPPLAQRLPHRPPQAERRGSPPGSAPRALMLRRTADRAPAQLPRCARPDPACRRPHAPGLAQQHVELEGGLQRTLAIPAYSVAAWDVAVAART